MNLLEVLGRAIQQAAGLGSRMSVAPHASRQQRGMSAVAWFLTILGVAVVAPATQAIGQAAPNYVVYSQILLSSSYGESRGSFAANSRGDLFANDGNGHVLEYPANGGAPITLWTDLNTNGAVGVAVDSSDNLYISNLSYSLPPNNGQPDSLLYKFPSTNQTYPAPYVYSQTSPPGSCTPAMPATATTPAVLANTNVCTVGLYDSATNYYWQGWWDTAVDGAGTVYSITGYDSHYQGDALGIFQCQISCAEQLVGNGASAYTVKLPNPVLTIAANYAGDLYFADLNGVYVIPAGSPSTGNTPTVFDASYNQPYGVSFDPSGNLYVTDATAIWEIPAVETAGGSPCKGLTDSCKLVASAKYKLILLTPTNTPGAYSSFSSPGIDNRGNIIFSPTQSSAYKYSLWAGSFPTTQIGATGSTGANFSITFDKATTLTSLKAVQGSAASTEFVVSPGTCVTGATFAAGASCSFTATFTPSGLGVRTGAVNITDATGKSTSTFLTGIGTGTGVAVDPGTPNQIGSGFKKPAGIALDNSGNVYVADSAANSVKEYPVSGGTAIVVGTGLNVPTGVAVDGDGNVYIVNQGTGATGGSVVEVPAVAGVLTNAAQTTLVSGLNLPTDIITDGSGNLYITVTGANQVIQLASSSEDSQSAAMVVRGYGLTGPTGISLDSAGNIYVADTGNNRVLQIGDGFQINVGSGLSAPTGVTVDPSGSVMIADGTGRLIRVPNESFGANAVGLNQADQQVLSSPLSFPYALRSDNVGNLYVTDSSAALVYQLQRTAGAINFGNWNLNTPSDTQTIVLSNIGTSDITIANPPFTALPAGSEFTVGIGNGTNACGSGLFHSGFSCDLQAMFDPTVSGTQTYPLVINAPAQNASAPSVKLTGSGVNQSAATLKLIQTAPTTTPITYGQQITISAKVTPTSSTVVPTGYVVFTFDGQNQRPIKLDATGAASITLNGLSAGSNTLSAYYEGDTTYASLVSSVLPLNIVQAGSSTMLTIVGDSATPLSVAPGNNFTLTATLTPGVVGVFTGTVNFVDLTTNTLLNAQPIRLGAPDPKTGLYVVSMQLLGSSAQLGTPASAYTAGGQVSGNIVAQYSGNSNYVASSSSALSYTVSASTYTITSSASAVTASQPAPALITLGITDYSNFQGGVGLQCTGLPVNAYCVFLPASAQLIPAPGLLPNTTLVPLTIAPVPVTLHIYVDQSIVPIESPTASILWVGSATLGFTLLLRRRLGVGKLKLIGLAGFVTLAGLTGLSGCGSTSNQFPTPPGTYAVTIMGTAVPTVGGVQPACQYVNCSLPFDPVTNPSIDVIKTVSVNLTVK